MLDIAYAAVVDMSSDSAENSMVIQISYVIKSPSSVTDPLKLYVPIVYGDTDTTIYARTLSYVSEAAELAGTPVISVVLISGNLLV